MPCRGQRQDLVHDFLLAATSMPRVGSSRISSRGSVASQRARRPSAGYLRRAARSGSRSAVLDVQRANQAVGDACCRPAKEPDRPRPPASASTMFSRTDSSAMMPSILRSSGHNAKPGGSPRPGREAHRRAVHPHLAAVARSRPNSSRAARSGPIQQPAQAHDLATAQAARSSGCRWPRRPNPGASSRVGARPGRVPKRAARRGGESSRPTMAVTSAGAEVGLQVFAHQPAVAQHRDAIGSRKPGRGSGSRTGWPGLASQPAHHGEELLDFTLVEAGGRLVEDQHPRPHTERAGNRDHLLHGDRVARQQPRDIDVEMQPRQQRAASARMRVQSMRQSRRRGADSGRRRCSRPPTGWGTGSLPGRPC